MFDYIVAGAGTAGCTLASRLTEDPEARVLLIEAGPPDRRREIHIPGDFPTLSLKSPLNWGGTTEPQTHLNERRLAWPRGKVLGGSGSIGAMIHLRGCRADYDCWRELGNAGWGFDDLQPFFGEAFSPQAEPNLLSTVFLDACEACGLSRYGEFQGPAEAGAGLFPLAQKKRARWSTADACLRPVLGRGNLTVWTGIQVTRVLIAAGRATGVEYAQRGARFQVRALREVILCGGAVSSPQLLLLSGVGPVAPLESLGIHVAAALPGVGENLQDHAAVGLSYSCTQPVSLAGGATRLNLLNYLSRRRGPLISNVLEAGAFAKSAVELPACDIEILFAPLGSLDRGLTPPPEHGFSLFAASLTTESRGRITLASADPLAPPRIDPAYLSDPRDRELLLKAVALARRIAESEPFSAYRGAAAAFALEDAARSLHHAGGSCKMGEDPASVVDSSLQVHGVTGLRVADASIMPVIPRAEPGATVAAIAEKAARLIHGH